MNKATDMPLQSLCRGGPVSRPPAPPHPRTSRLPTWKGPPAGFVLLYRYLWSLREETTTHSSAPARKIPWMEEPGGLWFTVSLRVGHN